MKKSVKGHCPIVLAPLFEDSVNNEETEKIRETLGNRIPNMFSCNPAAREYVSEVFNSDIGKRVSYVLKAVDPDQEKNIIVIIVKSDTGILLNCRRSCFDKKYHVGIHEEGNQIELIIYKN